MTSAMGWIATQATQPSARATGASWRRGSYFCCTRCSVEFYVRPYYIERGHTKFCSRDCANKFNHGNRRAFNKPAQPEAKPKEAA